MYYIKWYREIRGIKSPYLTVTGGVAFSPWDSLSEAKPFSSRAEAVEHMIKLQCSHWLELTTIVFIHPLNFEERCKRDI